MSKSTNNKKSKHQEKPLKIDGTLDDVLKVSVPKPKKKEDKDKK